MKQILHQMVQGMIYFDSQIQDREKSKISNQKSAIKNGFASYNLPVPTKLGPQPVSASRVSISQLMEPAHANLLGNVHGGHIMKLVDEAGALACMKHSRQRVVTVVVDRMTFKHPIKIGDLVTITAEVSYVGHTSMEVEVSVEAENPTSRQRWHTNTAYLVYVALDEKGRPLQVPPLQPENDFERQRMEQGAARQAYRLSQDQQAEAQRSAKK